MRKFQRIFVFVIFIWSFSIFAKAQGTTDYRFLEVVDDANQPVAGATVNVQVSCDGGDKTTNSQGQLERFPIGGGDCGQTHDFIVSKPGYYPFRDIGFFSAPYNDIYRNQFFSDRYFSRDKYRIELLKIPQNKAERKAVGGEQLKRELFWAVRDRDAATVGRLLKSGVDPNLVTDDLRGVLAPPNLPAAIYSAALGDIETVKEFFKAGVNPGKKDSPARGILLYYLAANPGNSFSYLPPQTEAEKAALNSFQDGVDFLINAGADIRAKTKEGKTALMIAAENGDVRSVQTLLAKDVPSEEKDYAGKTALLYATIFNYSETTNKIEIAGLLLKKGANPNLIAGDFDGKCTSALRNAVLNNNPALVKLLLDNKADVNLTCGDGRNALRTAVEFEPYNSSQKNYDIIKLLIEAGAKVNFADQSGNTNLMIAVSEGKPNTVEILLENGAAASVNVCNSRGETALMKAVHLSNNSEEIKRLLLKHGADPLKSVQCQPF